MNLWLYHVAIRLHRFFENKGCIAQLLEKFSSDCGRPVTDEEIWRAIDNSEMYLNDQKGRPINSKPTPRWPARDEEQIRAIAKAGLGLAALEAASPVRWDDGLPHTEEIIDILFPGNPLICAAPKKELAITRPREDWRGFMAKQQFVVPSPMTALCGKTKDGRDSTRCLANTGRRRFLVVEFDQGSFDQHAGLLNHLDQFAPLGLVVHSGNKSLHGWFFCGQKSDQEVEQFFRTAVRLGADPATWTRCQLVRMPGGQRDNGKRQRVIYFNPSRTEAK
ncbi:MAG TPA: hypothetical protein VN578_22580 [Candidatus Binatia bacterium]|nr:hypothetical protein [Candidatus Binatia bacterium]